MSRHAAPLVAFIAATTLLGSRRPGYPPPPATRADPVIHTIHGVAFPDPYRWLEDQHAPETRAWMTARLQAATGSGLPVALWYDERGGHAANRGRPLSPQVQDAGRELAFMAEQLGLQLWGVEP